MSVHTSVNNQGTVNVPVRANYTDLTINATASSRTAQSHTLAVGDVLVRDLTNAEVIAIDAELDRVLLWAQLRRETGTLARTLSEGTPTAPPSHN